ncbi:hypothetical protein J5N97_011506 [Dioscorea zingiberensis]|uniref:Uncharacterized protein n=1 Tax=Dioscorea zingiberensis TaxID=325984 RepID=A0A9D5HNT2_9LILI|nr:hypothetical protein J5N97_011506 [Dioscorea zingiberensis]
MLMLGCRAPRNAASPRCLPSGSGSLLSLSFRASRRSSARAIASSALGASGSASPIYSLDIHALVERAGVLKLENHHRNSHQTSQEAESQQQFQTHNQERSLQNCNCF